MRFEKIDNWAEGFRNDGMLFFAQRIQEMLFHYTDHVYKVPVMNTALLIDEYLETAPLVKRKVINNSHLISIMEEFQDSFNNDIVIAEQLSKEEKTKLLGKINSSSDVDKVKWMQYIKFVLSDYNTWCKEYLRTIVPQEKEKKKIERAIRCYLPGLLSAGYSHEYIFYYSKDVFFNKRVESIESLDVFLDRFDFQKRSFDVYIAIEKKALVFQDILEKRLGVEFDSQDNTDDVRFDRNKYQLIKLQTESYDEQSAAWDAYKYLDIFFKYYRFLSNQRNEWFFNTAKVVGSDNKSAFVDLQDFGLNYSLFDKKVDVGKSAEFLITSLQSNARQSYFKVNRALIAHNAAIDGRDIRSRFLNLWSVLEILYVNENAESKILELKKKILPILQRDYIQELFGQIQTDLIDTLGEEVLAQIKREITADEEDERWLFKVIAGKGYEGQRNNIYQLLADYPIIRSRISRLNELCSSKNRIYKTVSKFTDRISWHLTRLYRTRNSIIHSGDTTHNLRELAEHLHSYVDECLLEMIILLATSPEMKSTSNAILYVQLRAEDLLARLNSKDPVEDEDIDLIFSI